MLIVSFGVTQKVQLILLVTETHGWGEIVISSNLLALLLFFLRVSFRLIAQHFFLGLVCNNPGASSGKTLKNIERRSSLSKAACITVNFSLQKGIRFGSKC